MDETHLFRIGRLRLGNCNTSGCQTGSHLCPGCSDPYTSGLNGDQNSIGSRAWVNPFTGSFPSTANNHSGHSHDGVSHRILVETSDLIQGRIREPAILAKLPTSARMSIPGASRIQTSATCLTITPIVGSQLPAGLLFLTFRPSVLPSECNLLSKRGQLQARQSTKLNPIRVTMAFG